jgi:hypothetical protein
MAMVVQVVQLDQRVRMEVSAFMVDFFIYMAAVAAVELCLAPVVLFTFLLTILKAVALVAVVGLDSIPLTIIGIQVAMVVVGMLQDHLVRRVAAAVGAQLVGQVFLSQLILVLVGKQLI